MATGKLAWTVSHGDEVHIATHHEQRTSILTLNSIGLCIDCLLLASQECVCLPFLLDRILY